MFFFIFHFIIIISALFRILIRNDLPSSSRVTWFLIIIITPFLGITLYILFGEIKLGKQIKHLNMQIWKRLKQKEAHLSNSFANIENDIKKPYQNLFHCGSSINGFNPLKGNTAVLMENAQSSIDSIIKDIDTAKSFIHVMYYIWLDDNTGRNITEALKRAVKRGVQCKIMVDGLGSRQFLKTKTYKSMKEAGIDFVVSLPIGNPIKTILTSRIDLRNHRKITIIDGEITYCGSRNCADPEFRVKKKYAPWVDILLRFEGPVVLQMELIFQSDWVLATNQEIEYFDVPEKKYENGFIANVIADGPTQRLNSTSHFIVSAMESAKKEIIISNPYFVPDMSVLNAISSAAYRGINVILIFPHNNDSWIVSATSQSYYQVLLESSCKIYEYTPGLLHAKTLTIDGEVSFIGSTNLDLRSFNLNFENNILLQDKKITKEIRTRQYEYIQDSIPVMLEDVQKWTAFHRIWNNVIATLGPVL